MGDIGPGDFLECVVPYSVEGREVVAGRVYCVRGTTPGKVRSLCGVCSKVHTSGIILTIDPVGRWGWCPTQFRPFKGPEEPKRLTCEPVEA